MEAVVNSLNAVIWSMALVALCLGLGLYFSFRTRFMQVRGLPEMLRLIINNKSSRAGVSSFQALAMSLGGRVGTGNIAGVATAIAFGGPGAVFWMWVMAFLGASTSYIECTLAQIYKEKDPQGRYRGGPAYYIEKAMGQTWYAWLFAVATIVACGFLLPIVQVNTLATSMTTAFGVPPWVIAAVVGTGLALIIFGGVKRIATFAGVVVPFMAVAYILIALVIMVLNPENVAAMFTLIIESAFGMHAGFGAMVGLAVEWGVKRGIYSNEAGQGSGPHAAAAAEVQHPAQQGYVQAFSVYVDTLLVCSATAFMILGTGMYNVAAPAGGFLFQGLPGAVAGPDYPQAAIDSVFPGWGAAFVAVAILFFVFTTIVTYYYMAETNVTYINRKVHRPWLVLALRLVILAAVVFGVFRTTAMAWALGDIGVGLMAWLNLVAIVILQKPALLALRDYERQRRGGATDFSFDPPALGIRNAEYWERRAAGLEPDLPTPAPQGASGAGR